MNMKGFGKLGFERGIFGLWRNWSFVENGKVKRSKVSDLVTKFEGFDEEMNDFR